MLHTGLEIDLFHVAPCTVTQLAAEAAQWTSDNLALAAAFPEATPRGPIAWNSVHAAASSTALDRRQEAALYSMIGGPCWSASKAFRAGLLSSDRCELCGHSPGTVAHRRFDCPVWDLRRKEFISPETIAGINILDDHTREQLARGCVVFPAAMAPQPLTSDSAAVRWWPPDLRPEDRRLTGRIFTDGSCLHPWWGCLRRAGWACVQVDARGVPFRACYGAVPVDLAPTQDSEVAEDYAVFMASQLACQPFELYTDCASTVGRVRTPGSSTRHRSAQLWGKVWAVWDPCDIVINKAAAHTTQADVEAGRIAPDIRSENMEADKYAKKGAAEHPFAKELVTAIKGIFRIQRRLLIWSAIQEATAQDQNLKDCPELFQHKVPSLRRQPSLANSLLAGPVPAWNELDHFQAITPSPPTSHNLLLATLGPGQGGVLLCSRCGAFAHKSVRDLRWYCDPGKHKAARAYRVRRFYSGIFPGYDNDWKISKPHKPTPATVAWLCGRACKKQAKNPIKVPELSHRPSTALDSLGITLERAVREGESADAEWDVAGLF